MKKTALEKININNDLPKIKEAPVIWGGGSMLIPHPKEVMNVIDNIPEGKIMDLDSLRKKLAKQHNTDISCPMTTGIFVNLVGQAYDEGSINSPFWRVIRNKGELNHKFPGGIEHHKNQLLSEGFSIIDKNGKFYVKDYQMYIWVPKKSKKV
jgi:hypothetical protein